MRKIFLFLVCLSSFSLSAIDECKTDIYYANGILTTEKDAEAVVLKTLSPEIQRLYTSEEEMKKHIGEVGYSYNQTNGFILDGLETYLQKLNIQLFVDAWSLAHGYISNHLEDYIGHYNKYAARIRDGHRVLVVAHSQGNLFTDVIYKRLGSQSKEAWMQQYFGAVSVASPMNADISNDTERITWDNDIVGRWVAHNGTSASDEVINPIRRIEWEYGPCLITEENCTLPLPAPYAKKSDIGKVVGGRYTAEEYDGEVLFGSINLGYVDPASNVHAFTYYMGKPLAEDVVLKQGVLGGAVQIGRRNFLDPFDGNNTLQTNEAKDLIMKAIGKKLDTLEAVPSQWNLTDNTEEDDTECSSLFSKKRKCGELLKKVTHISGDQALVDELGMGQTKVYPFNAAGKVYAVDGKYVKASCGGEAIKEGENEVCYTLEGTGETLSLEDGTYEEEEEENGQPGNYSVTSGAVNVYLSWSGAYRNYVDMDLNVAGPGVKDVSDIENLFMEHYYIANESMMYPGDVYNVGIDGKTKEDKDIPDECFEENPLQIYTTITVPRGKR